MAYFLKTAALYLGSVAAMSGIPLKLTNSIASVPQPTPKPRRRNYFRANPPIDRSRYMPHQGEQEKARRRRQMGREA